MNRDELSIDNCINTKCTALEHRIKDTDEFNELYKPYELAIKEIESKLESIGNQLKIRFQYSPIYSVKSRLKTPSSIIYKLIRRGLEPNVQSAKKNLTDIAGVKIICNYIDDVYLVEELLFSKGDISIIRKSDYIKNPKPNGYRSLHIVVKVPISVSGIKQSIPVEIQIRTVAMDFWASLEHQICYKSGCDNVPDTIIRRLKDCAETIARVDVEMQNINRDIEMSCNKDIPLK